MSDIATGEGHRRVELPGSRNLYIRPVEAADIAGLQRLYGSLDPDDLYLRFFSAHAPPQRFVERMASVEQRGGCGLVAIVEHGDHTQRLVAEASFEPLPNGDAELGITIASDHRGWLGPYLLDTLIGVAAARGIPNLEAEVLVTNRRMLSLLRSRGLVYLDHYDAPATVQVAIGTGARVPAWPGPHDRPRLLVEASGGHWRSNEAARKAGFQVLVCPGPSLSPEHCPAVTGGQCRLASGADVIVDALAEPAGRALLEAHRGAGTSVPVCVQLPAQSDDLDPTVEVLPRGADDTVVIEILQRLAATGVAVALQPEATPKGGEDDVRPFGAR